MASSYTNRKSQGTAYCLLVVSVLDNICQCGGVLINHQHVVTAGHCIKNKNMEDLTVTLGEYNIAESRDYEEFYPSQTYKVRAMVVHPGFKFSPAADR